MVIREDEGGITRRRRRRASAVRDAKKGSNTRTRSTNESLDINASLTPAKRVLELILDTLQRRDSHELFAEPVDPAEVEDYYEIIKDPMDFGTMRAKLHENMYQFLHQFEHDVLLIFRNAMQFNTSSSIYFNQARSLEEMAHKVFHTLKTDPEKFEVEFATTKRRSARKIYSDDRDKDRDSNIGSCSKHQREKTRNGNNTYLASLVNRDGRGAYQPWRSSVSVGKPEDAALTTMYVGSTPLLQVSQQEIGYRESLMAFVNDLGPTAKRVAQRKMKETPNASSLNDVAIISSNTKKTEERAKRSEGEKTRKDKGCRFVNKKIVLAVPATPRARGGWGSHCQITSMPLVSSASSSKPPLTPRTRRSRTMKEIVKRRSYDPEINDIVGKKARNEKTEASSTANNNNNNNNNNNMGREFHFDISYLRSKLNGASHVIQAQPQPLPNNMQMQLQMQKQLYAFNSMWPHPPNSNSGA